MNFWLEGLLIIGGSTLVANVGMFVVRKRISRATLEACHEVGGILLAIVGTLYAILLGLIVVDAQSKVDQARQNAIVEANSLSNVYHYTRPFKQPAKQKIRDCLYDYAKAVSFEDWSAVEEGKIKEASIPEYRSLWRSVTDYNPQEQNEQQCFSAMLGSMQQLSDARRFRMVASKSGLSPILWTVLIVGGILIVLFTYFFFLESVLSQVLMTTFVVIFLSLNVFLVYLYQNPYREELGVKKSGFGYSFNFEWFKDDPNRPDPN